MYFLKSPWSKLVGHISMLDSYTLITLSMTGLPSYFQCRQFYPDLLYHREKHKKQSISLTRFINFILQQTDIYRYAYYLKQILNLEYYTLLYFP